jgi:hypothetical protein
VFGNTAVVNAMTGWLDSKQHKVITKKELGLAVGDGEEDSGKYFIAEHAAAHLNRILEENPRFKVDSTYAAALPIKVGVMRTWLKKYLGREWKANRKGFANAKHEGETAVGQRNE